MGIRDQAKRVASGASVALATSGLSSCQNNGAVDPPPPPLQCNTVNMGQTLSATATRAADTVTVTVRSPQWAWHVNSVGDVTGATITNLGLPAARSFDPLTITLRLATPATTQAGFTVNATAFGFANETCSVRRTFTLTISPQGVQVSLAAPDDLPLAARQAAQIVLRSQSGRVVVLEARTPFRGPMQLTWNVTDGELAARTPSPVLWTLPATPGIYQVELVIDYGADGLGYDVLLVEVT